MRHFLLRFRALLALAAALLGFGQAGVVRAETPWVANDDDAVLFEARLGQWRLGEGVRGYATPSGVCVDLADMIMALDIPVRLDKKLRRATGWAFSESNTLTIDREQNIVQNMNKTNKLAETAIYDTNEGWCVNAQALAGWLGITLDADTQNALLLIKSTNKLPVELQQERRSRAAKVRPVVNFDLKSLPQANLPYSGFKPPALDATVNMQAQRSPGGKVTPTVQYELYASGEAGPIAYDARLASDLNGKPNSLRLRAYRVDPEGKLLGNFLPATQIAAGDVTGFSTPLASFANVGRGAMITNRPLDRPDSFDRTDFRGALPSGWDAELYRNEQLLGFSTDQGTGRYEFLNVPLLYGRNRFEIKLYGPQGQTLREVKQITVGFDSIPPKQTWYWAGINQDGHDLIGIGGSSTGVGGWRGTFGLERGIDARTSIALGLNSFDVREVGRRNFVEASLRRAIGPALIEISSALDFVGGLGIRGFAIGQIGRTYFSAESIWARGGFVSDRVLSGVTGRHVLALDQSLKLGALHIPIRLHARYTTRADGRDFSDLSLSESFNLGRITLTNETSWRHDKLPFGGGATDQIQTAILGNARIGRVRLRGEGRFQLVPKTEFQSANLIAEWNGKGELYDAPSYRAEAGYDRNFDRGRFAFGYIRRFEKFALTSSAEVATDGTFAVGLSLSFSLGADPRHSGRVRVTSGHQASQSQILARVYRDVNNNGQRDESEPLEKDVQLAAGRVPVRNLTGTDGAVIIDELPPYMPVLVGIDASSLADPLLQPKGAGLVVTPRRGTTTVIDLPIVGSGEVEGTLMKDGGTPLEGIDLELVDGSGTIVRKVRSDYDGYFLFESVPYGKYSVRINSVSAEISRVGQALVPSVEVNDDKPSARLGTVVAGTHHAPEMASGP